MRADERAKLVNVVLARPHKIVRVAVESDTDRDIKVEIVKLEDPMHTYRQRAGLHLDESSPPVDKIICPRSRRGQRTAIDRKCQHLPELALNSA